MDFLHPLFEDQLQLQIDPNGNVVIGGSIFPLVEILRADSTAYEHEFSTWLSDLWLPEQNEILEKILNVHSNRKRFADLCATLKNGHLVPLIGSGMSVPSGIKSWSDFLRAVQKRSTMPVKELEDLLAQSAYEEAADKLSIAMPGRLFDECIEHDLRIDDSDEIYGSVIILPELFDNLILTTNLDDLLEKLYELRSRRFSHVLAGNDIGEYRRVKASSERVLLKFHGDCCSRNGRVLGKAEYERAYSQGSPVREELMTIYRTHSILCLGCSLGPDRTVGLLAEVAKMDPSIPKHYAFLKHPNDENALRDREHFLTDRGIFPIWYPDDHDESLTALFVGMMQHIGGL